MLGSDPQDLKYQGERTFLTIGEDTVVREFATVNRGTVARGTTSVGRGCLLMAYAHVAHDCELGDEVILANSVNLGGNVRVDDFAIIGGMNPVPPVVRIGGRFRGGAPGVSKDLPRSASGGQPGAVFGLNSRLDRRGFPDHVKRELRKATGSSYVQLNFSQALKRARDELHPYPEIQSSSVHRESDRAITL